MTNPRQVEISVVIPVLDGAAYLPAQLEGLSDQDMSDPWEVIIADNGSTDPSVEVASRYRDRLPDLKVIVAAEIPGVSHARNAGARLARGRSLLFLDADDEVAPGYVSAMCGALSRSDLVCARIDGAKLNPGWVRESRGRMQEDGPYMYCNNIPCPPAAAGGTLGVSRRLFDEIGGFDPQLLTCQDDDFCWRAQDKGAELTFVPDAVLHYRYRASLRGIFRQERRYGRSEVLLYQLYRGRGMPHLTARENLYQWKVLLGQTRGVLTRAGRAQLVCNLGHRLGRLEGSLARWTFLL